MSYFNDSDSSYVAVRKVDGHIKQSRIESAARGLEAGCASSSEVAKAVFHEIALATTSEARKSLREAYKDFLGNHAEEVKEGFETIRQA